MAVYQTRIPPSRRTEGYRIEDSGMPQDEKPSKDRALLFTPQASTDDLGANTMETLEDPAVDADAGFHRDLDRQISRISTRRSSVATVHEAHANAPTDAEVAKKLAASGDNATSKADLIKTYGKRKANKILAGKLAVEDGKIYDMSLVRACYEVNKLQFWIGAQLCCSLLAVSRTLMQKPEED